MYTNTNIESTLAAPAHVAYIIGKYCNESKNRIKYVVLGLFSGSRVLGGAEGVARLKLFKQSVFFQRPFPVLCFLFFFSAPNTTALLFSSVERGEIRCHHFNIKVPRLEKHVYFSPSFAHGHMPQSLDSCCFNKAAY